MSRLLAPSELPIIPGYADAPEPTRRLLPLHRVLSRHSTKKDKAYFLSYRDAAKICGGLSQQAAHTITFALTTLGAIKIISKGKAGLNSGEASEFRCLLPQTARRATMKALSFSLSNLPSRAREVV